MQDFGFGLGMFGRGADGVAWLKARCSSTLLWYARRGFRIGGVASGLDGEGSRLSVCI